MSAQIGLRVQRIEFRLRAVDAIDLGPSPGSTLRGAVASSLLSRYQCEATVGQPDHWRRCPTCHLLRPAAPDASRGRDLPRPYAIEPGRRRAAAGERWSFSLTLIGSATQFHEDVVAAVASAASAGIGRTRGRSTVLSARWISPVTGASVILRDDPIVPSRVAPVSALRLVFHTPLRLTDRGRLVRRLTLSVLVQRLIERLETLSVQYGHDPPSPEFWHGLRRELGPVAVAAELVEDRTAWHDAWSGSRRTATITPTGGLVGSAVWRGDLSRLVQWLRWGEALHVGKSAVKGDGWFSVETADMRGWRCPAVDGG